jgi:hypothetical protein
MKMTAAGALCALILAASAAPALAGGYWDGGIQSGPPGAATLRWDRNCPCDCPPVRQDYGERRDDRRAWSDQREDDSDWRDDGARYEEDYGPADYSDDGYGVGPAYIIDEDGGGGGFANAEAFAGGGADFELRDGFGDHFRDRDHFRDHDHRMQTYPPHPGSWAHMGGYSRPSMHSGRVTPAGGHRR